MHRRWVVVACALFLAALVSVPAFGSWFHSFDASNESWQTVSYPFRSHVPAPGFGVLPFDGAFGNPAGSVRVGDAFPETGSRRPPITWAISRRSTATRCVTTS